MRYVEIVLVLLVLLVIFVGPVRRVLLFLFLRVAVRAGLGDIGKQAMAKLKEEIHLTPESNPAWRNVAAVEVFATPLLGRRFTEAGTFSIPEMPGLFLRFLVHPELRIAACIYDHPKAGIWLDLYSHYADGTSITFTTRAATGLDERPGAKTVHATDTTSDTLFERMINERLKAEMMEMNTANIVARFEDAYAKAMAWRKNKGISPEEVAGQIKRKIENAR